MRMNPKHGHKVIIALDFDGTLCTHAYPEIGEDVGAFPYLLELQKTGKVRFAIWTMRASPQPDLGHTETRNYLQEAVEWVQKRGVKLWALNGYEGQLEWTASPKLYAHIYIDDAALGCPLVSQNGERPYADWSIIGPALLERVGLMTEG